MDEDSTEYLIKWLDLNFVIKNDERYKKVATLLRAIESAKQDVTKLLQGTPMKITIELPEEQILVLNSLSLESIINSTIKILSLLERNSEKIKVSDKENLELTLEELFLIKPILANFNFSLRENYLQLKRGN